jgi:hypothetical protein
LKLKKKETKIKMKLFGIIIVLLFNFDDSSSRTQGRLNIPTNPGQQYFIEQPTNVSVLVGGVAHLECTIGNQQGDVTWCKSSFCTFGRRRNISDPRMSIVGDEKKGEHNLLIKDVDLHDNTRYQCQVTATDISSHIQSNWAWLTVLSNF